MQLEGFALVVLFFWLIVKPLYRYVLRLRRFRLEGLYNRAIFITGCDSGFGEALARRLDRIGVPVYAGCMTEAGLRRLEKSSSNRLVGLPLDVLHPDSIEKAVEVVRATIRKYPNRKLWGLVNNAGILGSMLPFDLTPEKEIETILSVNYLGAMRVTKAFLPLILESRGRMVFTASVQSVVPAPALAGYTASKFALSAFCKVLRIEMSRFKTGVIVSAIYPSGFQTKILSNITSDRRTVIDGLPEEKRRRYAEKYLRGVLEQATPDQLEHAGAVMRKDLSSAVDCFENALFSRYPQAEYIVGPFCGTLINLYRCLPESVFTRVISLMYQFMTTPLNLEVTHHEKNSLVDQDRNVLDEKDRKVKISDKNNGNSK
jgi:NAD(P)-dependent dehydrogenase (short-subunit alcohol dehydrogenase family)